ncbi:uncharacterized protein BJ212DRAFT_1391051 [Suillus subaureus]|uniref:Uncharacterized protein n=1 Tax=Suillus subaureus TaxID=48587 RepID=A0A9P7J6X1_9AGAM|nr:uncharacterized protein BJ212DRAFT_1391051 [Suillus subaureus]KAG1805696.1 hypothetical protein BJ212DRAFT_1391051 [Suillus subaureus]
MPSKPPFEIRPGNFSLNVSGVAGFFGGDEAISAIQTIHHYKARKFLGWYNSPGSWNVGKKFGKLAKSRFWDGLFPGPDEEPAKFFELDGKQGPKYVASRSGSVLEHTGHLAYLIMQKSKEELGYQVKGRVTKRNKVTIIKTQLVFEPAAARKETPKEAPKDEDKEEEEPHKETHKEEVLPKKVPKEEPVRDIPPHSGRHTLVAILPIAVSFTTCALCGWTHDWFCFSMILLGIMSSGISSVVIGSACLKLQGVNSAPTAPPGDGMLMDGDDIVLLLGKEGDVATITRGKFILKFDPWVRWRSRKEKRKRSVPGDGVKSSNSDRNSDAERGQNNSCLKQVATPQKQVAAPTNQGATSPKLSEEPVRNEYATSPEPGEEPVIDEYAAIGLCSLLLVIQLLGQLLLIPQGTLFGQIMFLSSFAASWAYNLYLSSIDNEYIQEQLILKELHLEEKHMQTYIFGTRTTAAVFACLMLQPADDVAHKYVVADKWKDLGFEPESIIRNFIPNDTQVWVTWRKKVLEVMKKRDSSQDVCHSLLKMSSEEKTKFGSGDKKLLEQLLEDARVAYNLATEEQWWLKND